MLHLDQLRNLQIFPTHLPTSHLPTVCPPSSMPSKGNNQHTVFYVLGLRLDDWEGYSTGTVGINVACFNFPGPPCSYFRYLNENVRCHCDQYLYTHTHTPATACFSASDSVVSLISVRSVSQTGPCGRLWSCMDSAVVTSF